MIEPSNGLACTLLPFSLRPNCEKKQEAMETNDQKYWRRSNGVLIIRESTSVLEQLNDANREVTRRATGVRRFTSPPPKIADAYVALEVERKRYHVIYIYRVDYRTGFRSSVGKVVKFSKRCHAPCRTKEIWLATPSYYRDQERLPKGIADPHDSTLTRDIGPWISSRLGTGSVEAKAVFSSRSEPWVYCTSHLQTDRAYRQLRSTFSDEYDYDAATEIVDVDGFAKWLGVDFALQIDKCKHLKLNAFDILAYARSKYSIDLWKQEGAQNIDTFVRVYHGPVHYEDESGVATKEEELADIHDAPRAWFTKRTEFADHREYRFAISTLGNPTVDVFKMDVSDELRQLTMDT